jgi:hypothetical protein
MPSPTQSNGPQQVNIFNPATEFGPSGAACSTGGNNPGGEETIAAGTCLACYKGFKLPQEGATLAPWVAITFEGSGSTITVGNDSSPSTTPANVACIKSFEFGYSDGLTLRCVIHDEQGGSFVQFMSNLFKDYICLKNGMPAAVRMKFQFGWASAGCSSPLPVVSSPCYYALSDAVETNYTGGKFMFDITGKDLCHRMFEGSTNQQYGGDGDKGMHLKQAIREYMTQNSCGPNVGSVEFKKIENGTVVDCDFTAVTKQEETLGPKGKWLAQGQDKMACVLRWLSQHRTKGQDATSNSPAKPGKGWVPQYNSQVPNGELIFWEDPKPTTPQNDAYWDSRSIGTYIVNGGKKSSVIEFNPKIRWDFARLTSQGGNLGSGQINPIGTPGSTQAGRTESGLDAKAEPCAGHNTQTTTTETQKGIHGKNDVKESMISNNAAARALKILTDNIEADLTIVGDPTLLPPSEAMWAKNVGIVLVNPFFIRTEPLVLANPGLEWMSYPTCNEILSNKAWICKSITHKIEAGNYTTTIGVFLTTPGSDADAKAPLGLWSGSNTFGCTGWSPTSCK